MRNLLEIIGPIYLLIAAGFVAVRSGWVVAADLRPLGRFVAQFCVPALLFRAVSKQSTGAGLHLDYLLIYATGSLTSFGLVALVARRLHRREPGFAALQGMGASASNSAFIGYPIVLQVVGPTAALGLALCTLVENLLVIPLGLALAGQSAPAGAAAPRWRSILLGVVRNPMILAILAGLLLAATGLPQPTVLEKAVGLAANAASPTALFVIGGSLAGLRLEGMAGDILLVAGGKLALHPACVAMLMWLWPSPEPGLRAAAILFASMPMLSIYPVLAQRSGHERFCAAALLAATLGAFVSIGLVISALPASWTLAHP